MDHVIAGKAIALGEDLQPEFKVYAQHIIDNAKAMAKVFNDSDLVRVISGGTDNHLMTIDVTKSGLNGRQVQDLLDTVYITVNKEAIPNETLGAFKTSGIRLGTPAITTRGFDEADATKVAELILQALQAPTDQANLDDVKQQAMALTAKHPIDVD
ncbi:Serine hydroxymethyltransferase [Lactiplantibacillus plantarum]|uniref:Serine hydroxymethyltransferase n=1 Tax=Lactiplantibacillus plantarum TaxID=1590 RepID=A0A162GGH4_LACPN|nr:Serine hydroxymethyltransferase [Lactiplantibacillus plantarum]